jgi:uncharacterized HhH-GPD family protein
MSTTSFFITGDEDADRFLGEDPLALLLGMLLDQQVPMEWAFAAPATLRRRLGVDRLDAHSIAAIGEEKVVEVFCEKPALHRYPGSMGKRAWALCQALVEEHDGDPTKVWTEAADGTDLVRRLKALPGFGDEKAKIFAAVLGKRLGVAPAGWEEAAAPFSDAERRSVADADTPEHLEQVRAWKKMMKAQKRSKQDAPV